MKTFIDFFKKGFGFGLGIVLIFGIFGIIYASVTLTATSNETITADKWNNLITTLTIPTGTIIAYNGNVCPTGRSEADGDTVPTGVGGVSNLDLRGSFLRGLNGTANSRDVSRTIGDYQVDIFKNHTHHPTVTPMAWKGSGGRYTNPAAGTAWDGIDKFGEDGWEGSTETRPKNVAVLYCVKE